MQNVINEYKKLWSICDKCGEEIRSCDAYCYELTWEACKKCAHNLDDEIYVITLDYFEPKDK